MESQKKGKKLSKFPSRRKVVSSKPIQLKRKTVLMKDKYLSTDKNTDWAEMERKVSFRLPEQEKDARDWVGVVTLSRQALRGFFCKEFYELSSAKRGLLSFFPFSRPVMDFLDSRIVPRFH
jgi:hypothetical protein